MKNIFLTVLIISLLFVVRNASAEPYVFGEVHFTSVEGVTTPTYDMYASDQIGESRFGVQLFGALTPGWGLILGGPTVSPIDGLTLGAAAGVQSAGNQLAPRYATTASFFQGDWGVFAWTEFDHNGLSGFWYETSIRYQATDWLKVGLNSRRFVGSGPAVWVSIPKTQFLLWGSWNPIDFEMSPNPSRGMGGVMYIF